MLSIKMSQLHIDHCYGQCNNHNCILEADMKDITPKSRKRLRSENQENERPRKIRREASRPLEEVQILKSYEYENRIVGLRYYKENLQPRKVRA